MVEEEESEEEGRIEEEDLYREQQLTFIETLEFDFIVNGLS